MLGWNLGNFEHSYSWPDVPSTLSLVDYDVIILCLQPLRTAQDLDSMHLPSYETFASIMFGGSSKKIYAIGRPGLSFPPKREATLGENFIFQPDASYSNRWWLPALPAIKDEISRRFEAIESNFEHYVKHLTECDFCFDLNQNWRPLHRDIASRLNNQAETLKVLASPVILNGAANPVAVEIKFALCRNNSPYIFHNPSELAIAVSEGVYWLPPPPHEQLEPAIYSLLSINGISHNLTQIENLPGNTGATVATWESKPEMSKNIDPKKVFVIYGRNKKARRALFDWLRSLKLEPLEWEDAVKLTRKSSPTTLEVIEAGLDHAAAVIALMTGDEDVRLREELLEEGEKSEFSVQPRPNVLFEAGMACAAGGRDRTVFVELGSVRRFSDIDGLNTIRLGENPTHQSLNSLKNRLETAGCRPDATGEDWLDPEPLRTAVLPPK